MKTTIEIADSLLAEAKRRARQDQTTLRALVEEGLHRVLTERSRRGAFRLRDASFGGEGLNPDLAGADWSVLRDLSYQGRGG